MTLALVTVPLAALADEVDAEAKALAERKVERYEVSMPGASIKAGGAMALVDAPMATVRKTVQDYGKYSTIMPRFKKSRVISKKDGKTDVYVELPILNGAATVWSQTRFEAPVKEGEKGERISGKMVDGNVEDMRTVFHLRPVDDTHTVLKCEILVVPKLPLPGSVVTPELQFAADSAVKALRDRSEQKTAADGTAKQLPSRSSSRASRGADRAPRRTCARRPRPSRRRPARLPRSPSRRRRPRRPPGRRTTAAGRASSPPTRARALEVLQQRCAPGLTVHVAADAPTELAVPELPKGACLRAFAAGAGSVELALLVGGAPLASHATQGFAAAPADGVLCPAGPVTLRAKGAAKVVVLRTK